MHVYVLMGQTSSWDSVLECLLSKLMYFVMMKIFWNQTVAMTAQPCEYTKNYY